MENNNEGRINNKIKPKLKLEPKKFKPEGPAPLLMLDEMWLKQRSKSKYSHFTESISLILN